MKMNNTEYERLADHIGRLPVVIIAPVDTILITEGSEERRRFVDSIISQYDKLYLDDLINYNKALSQRNALLKQFAISRSFDTSMLEIYDEQLINLGENIFKKRFDFIRLFTPYFKKHYQSISSGSEQAGLHYDSALHESRMAPLLKSALDKDRALQFTTVGIHKDDLQFTIDEYAVKRFASQGQQKSFLVALKLAQFDFIKEIKQMKPILLLDDVFDKLDDLRVKKLMELVSNDNFGQIFITDTHPERVQHIFDDIKVPLKIFKVANGEVS
jgi:DNA replication and repair protein RecF